MNTRVTDLAFLSNKADYSTFTYGGKSIRFATPYSLKRYLRVKKYLDGYIEVDADYGDGVEEDYIDLRPIVRNLLMNPRAFLKPVKRVEVRYAEEEG